MWTGLWERPSLSLETPGIIRGLMIHLCGWRWCGTRAGEEDLDSQRAWLLMQSLFTPRGVTMGTQVTCLVFCALEAILTCPSQAVGRGDGITPSLCPHTLSYPPCGA